MISQKGRTEGVPDIFWADEGRMSVRRPSLRISHYHDGRVPSIYLGEVPRAYVGSRGDPSHPLPDVRLSWPDLTLLGGLGKTKEQVFARLDGVSRPVISCGAVADGTAPGYHSAGYSPLC